MTSPTPLAVSVGDPGGIGPRVAMRACARAVGDDRVLVFGDADHLQRLLEQAGAGDRGVRLEPTDSDAPPAGHVGLVHLGSWEREATERHAPTPSGGRAQLASLDAAIGAVTQGRARALVTGPTSKRAIAAAGTPFVGQTEHLARAAGLGDDDVTMMFLGPRLRVALVTTHLSVRALPDAITAARVERTIRHLAEVLLALGISRRPLRVVVTGLNPHAGEGGLFGDEEPRAIAPGIERARASAHVAAGRVELEGPRPAEAAFRAAAAGDVDGVVAMMHDQATIASKLLDWGSAVNVTWGLPFVRTSVDHGVAYDAAARGEASAEGMEAALRMARRLTGS
ncbi:MAG: PdxA family dehydrogenase [Polyangiales bacterium]